jgi:hypothetical protein
VYDVSSLVTGITTSNIHQKTFLGKESIKAEQLGDIETKERSTFFVV